MARRCFEVSELRFEFACTDKDKESKRLELVSNYLKEHIQNKEYTILSGVVNAYPDIDTIVDVKFSKKVSLNILIEMLKHMSEDDIPFGEITYADNADNERAIYADVYNMR